MNIYKFSVFEEDLIEMLKNIMVPLVLVHGEELTDNVKSFEKMLNRIQKSNPDDVFHGKQRGYDAVLERFHDTRLVLKKMDMILGEWQEAMMHHQDKLRTEQEKVIDDAFADLTQDELLEQGETIKEAIKELSDEGVLSKDLRDLLTQQFTLRDKE